VRRQTLDSFDLIVVDDVSTDGSESVVCEWLETNASRFGGVQLVRHMKNSGPMVTRNTAIELSGTRYCFFLDADNQLYPRCLEQCVEAANESSAAVVYPILEVFGGRSELLNRDLWNPQRFAEGNYIDTMALVRRDVLVAVGGYSMMQIPGWEDYELWCKLIEAGHHGVRVQEILARYRFHGGSLMRTLTNEPRKFGSMMKEIKELHPWLSFPVPSHESSWSTKKVHWFRRVVGAFGISKWTTAHSWRRARPRHQPAKRSPALDQIVEKGCFDLSFYLDTYPDVARAGVDPKQHFLSWGFRERRASCSAEQVTKFLKVVAQDPKSSGWSDYLVPDVRATQGAPPPLNIGVYTSSKGSFFIEEMRDLLVEAFRRCGCEAHALNENSERPPTMTDDFVVAPHEFFVLGRGPARANDTFLRNAMVLNTENLPTTMRALPFLEQARVILDMNPQSAAVLRYLGIPAHFLPLGHLENYRPMNSRTRLPDDPALAALPRQIRSLDTSEDLPLAERPVDIMFIGTLSERRQTLFARFAPSFHKYRCFFHISSPVLPTAPTTDGMHVAAATGMSRVSKILLNIHRDEIPRFPWHRMVFQGFWQKTLVITEPCHEVPGFQPGVHYLSCDDSEMPQLIDWILNTEEGRDKAEQIRLQAFSTLSTQFVLRHHLRHLIDNVILDRDDRDYG